MREVKIIAHRGANAEAPQNTLPAFRKAIEYGADGFETDVHLTKDGVPVICHNYTVDDTSSGKGKISSFTLQELKELDFGSYFSPEFAGTGIPTLDEFLELTAASDIEIMNIELKSPREKETDIVKKTLKAVKAHNLFDRLIISSFDKQLLKEAKEIDGKCRTGFLYSPNHRDSIGMGLFPVQIAKSINVDALHPLYYYVSEKLVRKAHQAGMKVNVWTVNKEKTVKKMVEYGVDGIITDIPDKVRVFAEQNK